MVEDYLTEFEQTPQLSAWEQMKAREQQQAEEKQAQEDEIKRLMDQAAASRMDLSTGASSPLPMVNETLLIERELQRQKQALETAQKGLLGRKSSEKEKLGNAHETFNASDEDDEFDFEAEEGITGANEFSRYRGDFVEMGVLGRGGGGEVVKVRNRLDRRIYAVKKIILEPESGRHAKSGALQNRKLRREVTTISRMTHKYIVRYYQAWVEGEKKEDTIKETESSSVEHNEANEKDSSESTSTDENSGWWAKPTSDSQSTSPQSDNDESMNEFLGAEGFTDFGSPLLTGLGFQNVDATKKKESTLEDIESSEDDPWDNSSVKVDSRANGKAILYIQMEYCASTLRKSIDDWYFQKCNQDEIWRIIHQIVEGLSYLHSRQLIHRDLKPSNGIVCNFRCNLIVLTLSACIQFFWIPMETLNLETLDWQRKIGKTTSWMVDQFMNILCLMPSKIFVHWLGMGCCHHMQIFQMEVNQ